MDPTLQNFFYTLFLTLHNLTRWLVVGFAVWALVRAYRGWRGGSAWTRSDDRAGILFTSMMDTEVLLGLVLYFLFSPYAAQLFADFNAPLKNSAIVFFGIEHVAVMVVAMIVAHVGRALSRKAAAPAAKHRAAALGFSLAVLLVLVAIPWPFLSSVARPWFRLLGLAFY